ncbi:MAG: hypothetical protein IPM66_09850 [Acidobacteriota bacterium]|nr:MAG: hypothetical protein IPM66_09850 [Acidobacteriota bacterium]
MAVNDKWKMINDKRKMNRAASDESLDSPCLDAFERLIDTVIALIDLPGRHLRIARLISGSNFQSSDGCEHDVLLLWQILRITLTAQ